MIDEMNNDPGNVDETAPLQSIAGSDVKPLTEVLGVQKPVDPIEPIRDELETPSHPKQDQEDIDAAQKAYEDFVAADESRVPNVVLAPSKEDQALNAGLNVVGRSQFLIPNVTTQTAGFHVADPGRLVHQHRQYKHFVKKGDSVPSVQTN